MSRDTVSIIPAATQAGASVLLVREGTEASSVLLRALTARGLTPTIVHDEPGAMLALAEDAERRLARRVLIVIEPDQWARLGELAAAVRAFHTPVHCWQFDVTDGAVPKLSSLEADAGVDDGHAPVGRIRKRARPVDRLLVSAPGRELTTREVVTQQELTMLLGPAPGEAG
ncbi:MAG: hypothetical protein AAF085_05585 [Planctomycetota bacterium]